MAGGQKKAKRPRRAMMNWFRIQYILLTAMAFFGYLFYQNYAFFVCSFLMAALPVYSYLAMKKLAKSMEVSMEFSSSIVEVGSILRLEITASNSCIFPTNNAYYRLYAGNSYYPNQECYEINLPVHAKGETKAVLEIEAKNCGMLCGRLQKVFVCDMCNFFMTEIPLKKASGAEAYVLPEKRPIEADLEFIRAHEGDEEELEIEKGDDPSILMDIRSYIPGDRMQRVHWKLTARQDELMVKEYGKSVNKELYILLELYDRELCKDMPEAVIGGFYNLAMGLLAEQISFSAGWWNAGLGEFMLERVLSEEDLYDVLWQIYRCGTYKERGSALDNYRYEYEAGKATVLYLSLEEDCKQGGGEVLLRLQDEVVIGCL